MNEVRQTRIASQADLLFALAAKGGPDPSDYSQLDRCFSAIARSVESGEFERSDLRRVWDDLYDVFSVRTLQGYVCRKPRGYAGDFEILDRIHREYVSTDPTLAKWDLYFQSRPACRAVRNRKRYFSKLLCKLQEQYGTSSVLNVGSGSGVDLLEHLKSDLAPQLYFECLDIDPAAADSARRAFQTYSNRVSVICANVFRFQPQRQYDLIWSAGLFDYLDDRHFKALLLRLSRFLSARGFIVVGNFAKTNPTRAYMEFGEWFLNHRSSSDLYLLAASINGVRHVTVDSEPEQVNLFLRICTDKNGCLCQQLGADPASLEMRPSAV